ncbi:hypothetical protein QBC43DRAFT_327223 [Cladorrhinum sp. PSN259]|nr:hypothetical protein QBC43DRAFT_327223 [Cladorrhinum sp. PSN259]
MSFLHSLPSFLFGTETKPDPSPSFLYTLSADSNSTTMPQSTGRRVGSDSSLSTATILETVRTIYPKPGKLIEGLLNQPIVRTEAEYKPIPGGYSVFVFGKPSSCTNAQAALVQITGQVQEGDNACLYCKKGNGVFRQCVANPSWGHGSCANCQYNSRGSLCSFRTQDTTLGAGHVEIHSPTKSKRKSKKRKLNWDRPGSEFDAEYDGADSFQDVRQPGGPTCPIVIDDSDPDSHPHVKREPSPAVRRNIVTLNVPTIGAQSMSHPVGQPSNSSTGNTDTASHLETSRSATPTVEPARNPEPENDAPSLSNLYFSFATSPTACHGLPSPTANYHGGGDSFSHLMFRPEETPSPPRQSNEDAAEPATTTNHAPAFGPVHSATEVNDMGRPMTASDRMGTPAPGVPPQAPHVLATPAPSAVQFSDPSETWNHEIQPELRFKVESNRESARMQTELADKLQAELDDKLLGRGPGQYNNISSRKEARGDLNWEIKELSFKIEAHRNYAKTHTEEANGIIAQLSRNLTTRDTAKGRDD